MKTPDDFSRAALASLREGGPAGEGAHFEPGALEKLRSALAALPHGQPLTDAIIELGRVAVFLLKQVQAPTAAKELGDLIETFAEPELKRKLQQQVELTNEKVEAIGKKFESFLGSRGEQLADTGERLNLKPFKGPIRG